MPGKIRFSSPAGNGPALGPFQKLRFEGEKLYAWPQRELVAEHVGHHWVAQGKEFSRLDLFADEVLVAFEGDGGERSRELGPFSHFSCVNGVAYGDRRIVAFCDPDRGDWFSYDVGSRWSTMVVTLTVIQKG